MSDFEPESAAAKEEKTEVTPKQRYQMIAEAAYLRAEKRGFIGGDVTDDWLKAEAEIDRILQPPSKTDGEEMTTKQAFLQKLEMQLKEWDARFEELKGKAKKAKAEIRADVERQIAFIADQRAAAHEKMLELRQRTENTWEELKSGMEKTWRDLHDTLDRFVSRFK